MGVGTMRARSAVFTPRSGSCRGAGFCVARIGSMSRPERRAMVVRDHPTLSQSRQRRLLSIGRSSLYYEPKGESAETLALMRRIDELFLKYPCLRRSSDGASPAPRGRADRAAPGRLSDAPDGASGNLSGAAHRRSAPRPSGLPLSAAGSGERAAEPCLVRQHHLLDHDPWPLEGRARMQSSATWVMC